MVIVHRARCTFDVVFVNAGKGASWHERVVALRFGSAGESDISMKSIEISILYEEMGQPSKEVSRGHVLRATCDVRIEKVAFSELIKVMSRWIFLIFPNWLAHIESAAQERP